MLNNNPNPLRAAYPELDGRTPIEALQNPAIAGAAAGLPVFTGPGGVAEAKTAEVAREVLGVAPALRVITVPESEITLHDDEFSAKPILQQYGRLCGMTIAGTPTHNYTAQITYSIATVPAQYAPSSGTYFFGANNTGVHFRIGVKETGEVVILPYGAMQSTHFMTVTAFYFAKEAGQ